MTFYPPTAPGSAALAEHVLTAGDDVEVELLVRDGGQARLIEGTVNGATETVLVLEVGTGRRVTRIPWHAIAIIRNALTRHPADE